MIKATVSGGESLKKILEQIAKQTGGILKVGVLEGSKDENGEMVALRAYYNEFTDPKRPAFRQTIDANNDNWVNGLSGDIKGKMSEPKALEKAVKRLGQVMVADIKKTIGSGVGPSLAESTVAQKKAKGLKSPSLQLVETGAYQASIDYEFSKK